MFSTTNDHDDYDHDAPQLPAECLTRNCRLAPSYDVAESFPRLTGYCGCCARRMGLPRNWFEEAS